MSSRIAVALIAAAVASTAGCARDLDPLGPAPFPTQPAIFLDGFGDGVGFQAFAGSRVDAVQIDQGVRYQGDAALRVTVPDFGDPAGSYAGGAFVGNVPRDLTGYNALTFWARASRSLTLDVAGLGNDNTGTSIYSAEARELPVTTSWSKFVIPIPDPERLSREAGLFFFAEGPEGGQGATLWFDEVQFEQVSGLGAPRPAIDPATVNTEVGATVQVSGERVAFTVGGREVVVGALPGYFTFASSDETVATVDEAGVIRVVGEGSATITASLRGVLAEGVVIVRTSAPPDTPAPTPTRDPGRVVSLFSDAYDDVAVDTWSADWDAADVEDVAIQGNATKKYSNVVFAGIEATSAPIDATAMTHFHMDFYTPDPTTAPAVFKVKLVDFGADGAFGGGDDVEHEITLTDATTPSLGTNAWVSLDIPLADFAGLTTRGHIAQIILSGDPDTIYLDNVLFFDAGAGAPTEPATPAPTPTLPAANVISLFSDAYTDVTVDTWSATWDNADVADTQVQGNATKKYSNHVFAGIEFTSSPLDVTAMTHFHMDLWTPDDTADPKVFRIKLVDFGPDGAFAGGDDVEHEITFTASTTPALDTGTWVSLDVPLSAFTGLTTRGHVAQLITSGDVGTFFVDNVYFRN